MQGSWLQHDFGHGSPCKSRFWKKVFHYITGSLIMVSAVVYLNFLVTVKATPHECVIRTGRPKTLVKAENEKR